MSANDPKRTFQSTNAAGDRDEQHSLPERN